MARTVIEFPEKVLFSTAYTVLMSDVNRADHLGADRIFSIVIESQMRFFTHLGYDRTIEGVSYIVADTEFIFKAESKYLDELSIDVAASNIREKSCELIYRINNDSKNTLAALVKTGVVFVDNTTMLPTAIPDAFKTTIGG